MRLKRVFFLTITLVLCLFVAVLCQAEDMNEVINSIKTQDVVENSDAEQIIDLLLEAEVDGLPMRGLLNKVREGMAKRVDYWRIQEVLLQKKEYLSEAKGIIDDAESNNVMIFDPEREIEDLAKMLESGELSEVVVREVSSLMESGGKDWSQIIDACAMLGSNIRLDDNVKKEIIVIGLENNLDERSVTDIAGEVETASMVGEDLDEVLAKVRSRYQ